MGVFLTVVIFVVMLFFLVTCHELGHFVVSRRAGIVVEEFGIGLPPRLFSIKRGDTIYSINLLPLGAFVRPTGEDDPTVEGGLAGKGPWTRMAVYAAGPLVNVLLAFLFMTAFYMSVVTTQIDGNEGWMVQAVDPAYPAEQAGLRPGDVILKIDDTDIEASGDIGDAVRTDPETPKTILVRRDGVDLDPITVQPQYDAALGKYRLGVTSSSWLDTVIGVDASSPLAQLIVPGDVIVSVDGEWVYSHETFSQALNEASAGGEDFNLVLERAKDDGSLEEITVSVPSGSVDNGALSGVNAQWVDGASMREVRNSVWQALGGAWDFAIHLPSLIRESLPLIRQDPGAAVGGPVAAARLTIEVVRMGGFTFVLLLGCLISLGLAMFNFLPIPPLDGGGMLIALIEGLLGGLVGLRHALSSRPLDGKRTAMALFEGLRRGSRLSQKAVRYAYVVGTVLMILLGVLVLYNDITSWIRGENIPGL